MSKTPASPPPGDKPIRTAPPSPPAWRHLLWFLLLGVALIYILPPFVHTPSPVSLSYSQLQQDAAAGKVKTITIPSAGSAATNVTATGTLTSKKDFQAEVPYADATQGGPLQARLRTAGAG